MNVRIFGVRAMKCMYAQTRPRFILSSEGVFGGMEFEPMLTPREKSPLRKISPEEDQTGDAVDSEPKHYQLSYSGPVRWMKSSSSNKITTKPTTKKGVGGMRGFTYIHLKSHFCGNLKSFSWEDCKWRTWGDWWLVESVCLTRRLYVRKKVHHDRVSVFLCHPVCQS